LCSGPVVVRAYLPADDQLPSNRRRVEEALWYLGQIRPVAEPIFRSIAETDWSEAWKEKLTVLHIGEHIVIRPSWREYAPAFGDVVIELDPGQAFGTGLHPTTQVCLVALEELVSPGVEVLDLGTGSGILAIAAAKLGARRVLAADTDSVAAEAARANAVANHVSERVTVVRGSLAEITGHYDVVVVNILLRVILQMLDDGLSRRLRPGGILVLAGVLADQEAQVLAAVNRDGLHLVRRWESDDWVGLALSSPA
jgi:ribosomal protein L11 methyltransferase